MTSIIGKKVSFAKKRGGVFTAQIGTIIDKVTVSEINRTLVVEAYLIQTEKNYIEVVYPQELSKIEGAS